MLLTYSGEQIDCVTTVPGVSMALGVGVGTGAALRVRSEGDQLDVAACGLGGERRDREQRQVGGDGLVGGRA